LIFGLDGDTADSLKKTADTVMSWDVNYMYIFILTPLPGTRTYHQLENENRIIERNWSLYEATHSVIKFKKLTAEELTETVWESYQKFYSSRNILKRAWRFKKQYTLFFPRDLAVEEIFFSFLIRKAVKMEKHPFTLGLVDNKKAAAEENEAKGEYLNAFAK
jgi:radical SAM superfamily enzyme YgiQ (UPF0313 family)